MTPEECRSKALALLEEAIDEPHASHEWRQQTLAAAQAYATLAGSPAPPNLATEVEADANYFLRGALAEIRRAAELAGFDTTPEGPGWDISQWLIQEVLPAVAAARARPLNVEAVAAALREWNLDGQDAPQYVRFTMATVYDSLAGEGDPYLVLVRKMLELAREHG